MGKKSYEKTDFLRPTQDYLEQKTIDYYAKIRPEIPVVVGDDFVFGQEHNTKYFILDGHHNCAHRHINKEEALLWIASSPKDIIPYEEFPNVDKKYIDCCNEQIKSRFDQAQFYVPSTREQEIFSIDDLIKVTKIKY